MSLWFWRQIELPFFKKKKKKPKDSHLELTLVSYYKPQGYLDSFFFFTNIDIITHECHEKSSEMTEQSSLSVVYSNISIK